MGAGHICEFSKPPSHHFKFIFLENTNFVKSDIFYLHPSNKNILVQWLLDAFEYRDSSRSVCTYALA